MPRRRVALLTRSSLNVLLAAAFLVQGVSVFAQTGQPITSLPLPPGAAPATGPQQSQTGYPDNSVHPITSLPKPAQAPVEVTPNPAINTQPVMAPAPDALPALPAAPAPAADVAVPLSPSPAAPSPSTPGAKSYPLPDSAARAATAAAPEPVPSIDSPLPVSMPAADRPEVVNRPAHMRAFSTFGAQFKIGTAGIGFDIATPLFQHLNLRGGGAIFSYSGSYDDNGDDITGAAQFRSGSFYLDYFPFHNGLRLSGGVVINGNYLNAKTAVNAGQQFDLSDATYYSSKTDPVHGTASFNFGREIAPSFTLGWGNIVPRGNKHVSFPFEAGFMYTGAPTISLTLMGTVCDNNGNCQKIDNDPTAQANLQLEINNINSTIRFLRFYPILSQGISIKF